jgi:hypothetical protein
LKKHRSDEKASLPAKSEDDDSQHRKALRERDRQREKRKRDNKLYNSRNRHVAQLFELEAMEASVSDSDDTEGNHRKKKNKHKKTSRHHLQEEDDLEDSDESAEKLSGDFLRDSPLSLSPSHKQEFYFAVNRKLEKGHDNVEEFFNGERHIGDLVRGPRAKAIKQAQEKLNDNNGQGNRCAIAEKWSMRERKLDCESVRSVRDEVSNESEYDTSFVCSDDHISLATPTQSVRRFPLSTSEDSEVSSSSSDDLAGELQQERDKFAKQQVEQLADTPSIPINPMTQQSFQNDKPPKPLQKPPRFCSGPPTSSFFGFQTLCSKSKKGNIDTGEERIPPGNNTLLLNLLLQINLHISFV